MKSTGFSQDHSSVRPGDEFTLKENQRVRLEGTGFELKILRFFNSPCPPDVECVWSGIGIEFEYRYDGQVKRGINLVKAFGYKIIILRSDYESSAVLRIEREQD
jgi:uncharacterized protein YydD (DUF2326 family)